MVVGYETSKTFLHAALLDRESDELAKSVNSGFRKGETKRIVIKKTLSSLVISWIICTVTDGLKMEKLVATQIISSLLDFIPSVKDFRQTIFSVLLCVSSRYS